jgi:hypothetical protein
MGSPTATEGSGSAGGAGVDVFSAAVPHASSANGASKVTQRFM